MFGGSARARWFAVPVIAFAIVGLSACGSGSAGAVAAVSSTDTAAAASTAQDDSQAGTPAEMVAFEQCMNQHGVTRPQRPAGVPGDGSGGGPGGPGGAAGGQRPNPATAPPGVDQNTWTTARAACESLAPVPPAAPGN